MMKIFLLCALALVAISEANPLSSNDLHEWESFKVKYLRSYETPEEEQKRREIFVNHLKFIREHNAKHDAGHETYRVGVNAFADLSTEEFKAQMNGYKQRSGKRNGQTFDLTLTAEEEAASSTVDWRTKGAVTAIKDQGQCGGCWAFSATGALEGQTFLSTGTLPSLSEQNLIDCSDSYGNEGCDGGLMDSAFEYVEDKGIDTESSYPFTGEDGSCRYKAKNVAATCTGYVDITSGSEKKLKAAVAKIGPVSVAMDASLESFQLYDSGVYSPSKCSSTDLDHGVLAIGYGTSSNTDYWLIKNSWGTSWGLDGYFMMARNKNNMCGVATEASYPLV